MAEESKTKMNRPRKVQFEFVAPEAKEVHLAGNFNNWNAGACLMKKGKNGVWKTILPLEPGKYEYRFFIEGNWENDPSSSCCVPNEFGTQNCAKVVE